MSFLLHLLLLCAGVMLLPSLGRWFGSGAPQLPTPQVLHFHFQPATADVSPDSRTSAPVQSPILGSFASRARDRARTGRDTPVPEGGELAPENSIPGGSGALRSRASSRGTPAREATPAEVASTPQATADATAGAPPQPDGIRPSVADGLGSELALLTGRSEPSGPGHGARHTPRDASAGALEFGEFAFSTTAWDYEPYWHDMRERLYANWHPPAAYKDYGLIRGGWTLVRAVLDRQGKLRHAEIIGQSGHKSLHPASFAAMQGAAPFRPLPAQFPEDSLVVTVRFIYMPPSDQP